MAIIGNRYGFVTVISVVRNNITNIMQSRTTTNIGKVMTHLSLSITEVCAVTGIGRTKIYQAINSGALKARKLDKRTIILKDDLSAFLDGLETYSSKERVA